MKRIRRANADENRLEKIFLQLYVSGMSVKSMEAIANVRRLCDGLSDTVQLEIIDIYKHPELASKHQVIFIPSLVKTKPLPRRIIIGTFSDTEKVIRHLGIILPQQQHSDTVIKS
jgi:circadian clock protein KaiB